MQPLAQPKHVRDARRIANAQIDGAALDIIAASKGRDAKIARAFQNVYATQDGMIVLEHIMSTLCMIDAPLIGANVKDPGTLIARTTAFDIGREINRIIHVDLSKDQEAPTVKTEK